jgi:nitrogen permease regulator 2-like protein
MPSDGDSFLPRIQSVFYAVFDVEKGPKIIYQVPEGLVGVPPAGPVGNASIPASPLTSTPTSDVDGVTNSGNASEISLVRRRSLPSSQKRGTGPDRILFDFHEISKYIIPPSALCGRLVTCAARKYRIIGFPVQLRGDYKRIYFRYNLCFVFDRSADLSCYEPIVRKVSRVLLACEVRPRFSNRMAEFAKLNHVPGGIGLSIFSDYIIRRACYSRTAIRGFEFIFRNSHSHRSVQLD